MNGSVRAKAVEVEGRVIIAGGGKREGRAGGEEAL